MFTRRVQKQTHLDALHERMKLGLLVHSLSIHIHVRKAKSYEMLVSYGMSKGTTAPSSFALLTCLDASAANVPKKPRPDVFTRTLPSVYTTYK